MARSPAANATMPLLAPMGIAPEELDEVEVDEVVVAVVEPADATARDVEVSVVEIPELTTLDNSVAAEEATEAIDEITLVSPKLFKNNQTQLILRKG